MKTSKDKIEETLSYYTFKSLETLTFINSNSSALNWDALDGSKNAGSFISRLGRVNIEYQTLSDEIETRERSLASVRRAREKEQKSLSKDENKENLNEEDALEHFHYNVKGSYVGEKTPIWCWDNF